MNAPSDNAIPTRFAGRYFRSRLEARWAVAMTFMGIRFDYEPEGYILEDQNYLPDFWLPDLKCFIEIKGKKPTDRERTIAGRLAYQHKCPVYLFSGSIFVPSHAHRDYSPLATAFSPATDGLVDEDEPYRWCVCLKCGAFGITFDGRSMRLPCSLSAGPCRDPGDNSDKVCTFDEPRVVRAFEASLSSRFEHGESGAPMGSVLKGMGLVNPDPVVVQKPSPRPTPYQVRDA